MGGLGRLGLNSDQQEECKHIRTYQFQSDIVLVWNYVTRFRRKKNKKENSRITSTCRLGGIHSGVQRSKPSETNTVKLSEHNSNLLLCCGEYFTTMFFSMNGENFLDSFPSFSFSLLTGLLPCGAVCTRSESAIETTSVFFVGEDCLSTSLVTISQLSDFVVKAFLTHSSTVLNSLSSSVERLISFSLFMCCILCLWTKRMDNSLFLLYGRLSF
ncbi:hypothetical protein YC2023_064438 [Brassica napus]